MAICLFAQNSLAICMEICRRPHAHLEMPRQKEKTIRMEKVTQKTMDCMGSVGLYQACTQGLGTDQHAF